MNLFVIQPTSDHLNTEHVRYLYPQGTNSSTVPPIGDPNEVFLCYESRITDLELAESVFMCTIIVPQFDCAVCCVAWKRNWFRCWCDFMHQQKGEQAPVIRIWIDLMIFLFFPSVVMEV